MDFLRQVCSAVQLGTSHGVTHVSLPAIQLVEPSTTSLAEELENLDCLKPPVPGDNRVPLVENGNVFVPKGILYNIPWVVPRPDDAPKGQKKPAQKDAVYPSELVNHLLSLLVPDSVLMKLNATTLPVSIYSAIRDYLNYRLPPRSKMLASTLNSLVTNRAQKLRSRYMKSIVQSQSNDKHS
ncbi:hypothetical protein ONE63_011378 [Megalurothrips usitatus]|uniref:Uncharacterized protein n=1 Tax=Megalurothrips usitatus TaxID=439358 RepID=A0AAV7X363_9NEOP|nr:hypothetical protein ONE63_011378 [Megalurothrips usitatus]